ncbi:MAG: phosphatase domain-containing protein [Bdellovibrionia bacterium]
MSDWRSRSELHEDVVFFQYVSESLEKSAREVFIWDLDKTYLDTTIDSISGLFTTILERAFNKKNIPATNILLQSLFSHRQKARGLNQFPIYFITASPPQMEERISEKFAIDNIRPFGCFYKDNLANLTPSRFWRLRRQVGYKLQSLMQLRKRLAEDVKQICWGDDSETDAVIYNLYSDICARRLSSSEIRQILEKYWVTGEQVDIILGLQSEVPNQDPVEKIYINLAIDTDPDYYLKFGRRTVATSNTFQVALDLVQDQRLDLEALYAVAQDMIYNYDYTPEELAKSLDEMVRRKIIGAATYQKIFDFLNSKNLLHADFKPSVEPLPENEVNEGVVYSLQGEHEPWVPEHIDYFREYR